MWIPSERCPRGGTRDWGTDRDLPRRGGPAALIGPTGGYLVAFIAAAYVVGLLAEKGADRRFGTTVVTMIIGNAIIYIGGIMWLSCLISLSRVEFGFNRLLTIGVYPFIVGKCNPILFVKQFKIQKIQK